VRDDVKVALVVFVIVLAIFAIAGWLGYAHWSTLVD